MSDILEIELQLLKDNSTKSVKTTLKNGEEIILYSPKYVNLLENDNIQMQQKINKVASDLGHELYGHILQNDEETWNEEFYTDNKLDYRKLLIHLLEEVFEILEVDGSKWYDYE